MKLKVHGGSGGGVFIGDPSNQSNHLFCCFSLHPDKRNMSVALHYIHDHNAQQPSRERRMNSLRKGQTTLEWRKN